MPISQLYRNFLCERLEKARKDVTLYQQGVTEDEESLRGSLENLEAAKATFKMIVDEIGIIDGQI